MIKTRLIADMYRQAVHAARYFLVSLHQELTVRKHHSWGPASMQAQASNTLGIMYCGYMFVATSLHQYVLYCPLLHRPLRQYGAVRLDADITGELRESKSVSSSRFA